MQDKGGPGCWRTSCSPEPCLADSIRAFATARLHELAPPHAVAGSLEGQLSIGAVTAAQPPAEPSATPAAGHAADAGAASDAATAAPGGSEGEGLQLRATDGTAQHERSAEDRRAGEGGAATGEGTSGVAASVAESGGDAERRASGAGASTSQAAAGQAGQAGADDAAAAAAGDQALALLVATGGADGSTGATDSVEGAQQRCDLFCALCTKQPGLLPLLLQVYGQVSLEILCVLLMSWQGWLWASCAHAQLAGNV